MKIFFQLVSRIIRKFRKNPPHRGRDPIVAQSAALLVQPVLAVAVGINAALVLQKLHEWTQHNQRENRNRHNGRIYTDPRSIAEWQRAHFPWLSPAGLRKIFHQLESLNLITSDQIAQNRGDNRKSYALNYGAIFALEFPSAQLSSKTPSTAGRTLKSQNKKEKSADEKSTTVPDIQIPGRDLSSLESETGEFIASGEDTDTSASRESAAPDESPAPAEAPAARHWSAVKSQLELQQDRATYDVYLRDAVLIAHDDKINTYIIGHHNPHAVEILRYRLHRHIHRLLSDFSGSASTITIEYQNTAAPPPPPPETRPLYKLLAEQGR